MMPVGPLMIEHRLIERMIEVMRRQLRLWEGEGKADPSFIERAVDFIKIYADRCHHGKEEDILFRDLSKKPISGDLRRIMEKLVEEHRWGRRTTGALLKANEAYRKGEVEAASIIFNCVKDLVDFYPKHIKKEDRHFFLPVMHYFSTDEKNAMLDEEYEFDRLLIHDIYRDQVVKEEERVSKVHERATGAGRSIT